MGYLTLQSGAGVQTSQVYDAGTISSGNFSTVQVQQSPVKLEIPTHGNNTITTLDFDELLKPEPSVDSSGAPGMMNMGDSQYNPHKDNDKESSGVVPVAAGGGGGGGILPQAADGSSGLVGGGSGSGPSSVDLPQGDGSAIGGNTANGNDQRVVNVDEIITDGSVPPGSVSKASVSLDDKEDYDLSLLPPEVMKNLTIETYGGTDVFVSNKNIVSLAEYDSFLEMKQLNQDNFYADKCKAFAGCHAMGMFSPKAFKLLSDTTLKGGNKQFSPLSSEWNYNKELKSNTKEGIMKLAVEEFLTGYPPILQVSQKKAGNRHWVALEGIKVAGLVRAYESGQLDASKLTPNDFIVVDNAYSTHPIRSLSDFGRDFYGRWNRGPRDSDIFRIHSANQKRLKRSKYLETPENIRMGGEPNNSEK